MVKLRIKRITALFLCFATVLEIMYPLQCRVQAAGSSELSVYSFATKDELMTAFGLDGNADTVGKIAFGTNSKGEKQEWYIAGRDSGVAGDNIAIFAAEPISMVQMFNSDRKNKQYVYSAKTGYGDTKGSVEVFPNHYGASGLRTALNDMAGDRNYFSAAEQTVLNATKISTKDLKNDVEYTTTDKLYAPAGVYKDNENIRIGSGDTFTISASYWKSGKAFWLRSGYDDISDIALLGIPGSGVVFDYVNYGDAVRPASNLKLSDVLFASAATPAEHSFESVISTYMSLRFDCGKANSVRIASTATADIGGVKVLKSENADTSDLFLCVQGNDGENDWVYSKQITEDTTVSADDIKSEKKLSDIDLSKCKVWLETTVDKLTYAKFITVFEEHDLTLKDANTVDVTDENYSASAKYYYKCSRCGELTPLDELTGSAFEKIGTKKDTYTSWYSASGSDWSTVFLMYCMEGEGYLKYGYFTKTSSAKNLKEQVMKNGWYNYSFKQASRGDIAFMKVDGCEKTGIVSRVQGDKVYVVMGNYGNSDLVEEIEITKASGNIEMFGHIEEISESPQWYYIENVVLASGGTFIWPVSGANYIVTSCYGPRVLLGGTYHYGTDISCPTGTPVVAVMDGVVSATGYSSSMGNYVVVSHAGGYQTTYMHNSSIVAASGSVVSAGTVIALSGSTGQSTGPHCHIKVTLNGNTVDPAPYLGIPSGWTGNASGYIKNN
jgi:hypothetical protein